MTRWSFRIAAAALAVFTLLVLGRITAPPLPEPPPPVMHLDAYAWVQVDAGDVRVLPDTARWDFTCTCFWVPRDWAVVGDAQQVSR